MLVPAMSFRETIPEILRDYEIVIRKSYYVGKKLNRDAKKYKKSYNLIFDYKSKYCNDWFCIVGANKKKFNMTVVLHYYGKKGFRGVLVTPDRDFSIFPLHFLDRYYERMGLPLLKPVDMLKGFICRNHQMLFEIRNQVADNVFKVIAKAKDGISLGHLVYIEDSRYFHNNTFLTRSMLGSNQEKVITELEEKYNYTDLCVD